MKRAGLALIGLIIAVGGLRVVAQDANPIIPGQIAYIGADFNVYTIDDEDRITITNDAGVSEAAVRFYQFPVWSTDGRLAYFETEVNAQQERSAEVFISADGRAPGTSLYEGAGENFTYAYWSPRGCGEACRDLAVLLGSQQANGFVVNVIRDQADQPSVKQVGTGSPFYFSWSPDGQQMVWQRSNTSIDIYDINAGTITMTFADRPAGFFAPAWSPVDDRVLFGVANGRATDLAVAANGVSTTFASNLASPIWFSWSPDGNQIAYIDAENPLQVADAVTGEVVAESDTSEVIAFFWSPDSRSIAYVSPAQQPGQFNAKPDNQGSSSELSWSILDVASGNIRRYGSFTPTADMLYLLTYFDQFAQSHRVWSPDSRHLIYSELSADGTPLIMLLDTESNVVPLSIAEGYFGVWSFN